MCVKEILSWCMGLFPQGQNAQAFEIEKAHSLLARVCWGSAYWSMHYATLLILVLFSSSQVLVSIKVPCWR